MVATLNCQSTSNAGRRGNAKNGSKWPTSNHVNGLTLSRQCVHILMCAENKHSTPTHKEK